MPAIAAIQKIRRHLIHHLVVVTVALGMLLVPATCTRAAGPHSIFMDMSSDATQDTVYMASMPGMNADEHLLMLIQLGMDPASQSSGQASGDANSPTAAYDSSAEDGAIRISDLPSTMLMAAISTPVDIDAVEPLDLPSHPSAESPRSTEPLNGRVVSLELPPPR